MDKANLIESLTQLEIDIRFKFPFSSKLSHIQKAVLDLKDDKPVEKQAKALLEEMESASSTFSSFNGARTPYIQSQTTTQETDASIVKQKLTYSINKEERPTYQHDDFARFTLPWLFFNDTQFFYDEFLTHANGEERLQYLWDSNAFPSLGCFSPKGIQIKQKQVHDNEFIFVLMPIAEGSNIAVVSSFTLGKGTGTERYFTLKHINNPEYSTLVGDFLELYSDNSEKVKTTECPLNFECFTIMLEAYLKAESKTKETPTKDATKTSVKAIIEQPNWLSMCRFSHIILPQLVDNDINALFEAKHKERALSFISDWMERQNYGLLPVGTILGFHDYSIYDFEGLIIEMADPKLAPASKFICILTRSGRLRESNIEVESIYTLEVAEKSVSTPWVITWVYNYPSVQDCSRSVVKFLKDSSLDTFIQAMDAHVGTDIPTDVDSDEYPFYHLLQNAIVDTYDKIMHKEL
ncbi:hypothetical protein [Vibrio sp. HN007]|uniref:hypothetical protein n=1 Tax=Vibrio iocasae TaxID=3098914 RepID=UPI0035D47821